MKIIILSLSSAAAMSAALYASGHNLDAPCLLGICFCGGLLGLFASDYSRTPIIDLGRAEEPVTAGPARAPAPRRAPACQPVGFIIFNTTAA